MDGLTILVLLIFAGLVLYFFFSPSVQSDLNRKAAQNAEIICPHCGKRGFVKTEQVRLKKGISGGKATGAILTGGISLLATGLSRKEDATKACCSNCGSAWHY